MRLSRHLSRILRDPQGKRTNGVILFEDQYRVAIATGLRKESDNEKTGRMVQVWILARDASPLDAVATGADALVCGGCALRGILGKKRPCYVELGKAPSRVWDAYKRGRYARLPLADTLALLTGRAVRFGAYGDPAFLPFTLLRAIADVASTWTGYTHQWRAWWAAAYSALLMASADNAQDAQVARAAGWRTFGLADAPGAGEVACPFSERGTQCADCSLCSGASIGAKSITIPPHGPGAQYAQVATS